MRAGPILRAVKKLVIAFILFHGGHMPGLKMFMCSVRGGEGGAFPLCAKEVLYEENMLLLRSNYPPLYSVDTISDLIGLCSAKSRREPR